MTLENLKDKQAMRLRNMENRGKAFLENTMTVPLKPEPRRFKSKSELFSLSAPTDRPFVEVWHEAVPGFGARLMRANQRTGKTAKVYLARYKSTEGKDTKEVLGAFDELLYEDAQSKALERRRAVKHETKTGERPLPTLEEALNLYLAERRDTLAESSVSDYKKRWQYLQGAWGDNVLALSSDWWADKHRELMKIGRPTADGVMRIAHAVYQSLVDDERMTVNPVGKVASKKKIYAHGVVRSSLVKKKDLPVFWRWLHTRAHVSARDWALIALLQGFRDAVVGGLRWDQHVDMANRNFLLLPEQRGNKSKTLVAVPMCDYIYDAVMLPRWQARQNGVPWVIPSTRRTGKPLVDIRGSLETFEQESGGVHINPHLLRRTFSTIGQQATGSTLVVSRMLTHSHATAKHDTAVAVTAGYVVQEHEDMRGYFNATAQLMLELCGVTPTAQAAA